MADSYMVVNGAAPGAAAPVAVTTGTAIKTLLQIATSTKPIRIIEWSVSFDGSAAATPIKVELVRTTGAATVTAYVAADITKFSDPNTGPSTITLGTTASGYTASGEGTPGTSVTYFTDFVPPTGGVFIQYPLDREPKIPVSSFLRIRVTAPAAVNAYAHAVYEES